MLRSWPCFPQLNHLKMVTHMVFSPFLGFDFVSVALGCAALTAGPFMVLVLNLPFSLFCSSVEIRDDESKLDAAAVVEDGVSMGPPPSPPGTRDLDAAAVDAEETAAPSRLHSSLWPARHAARWQACLQYLRCRQPEQ